MEWISFGVGLGSGLVAVVCLGLAYRAGWRAGRLAETRRWGPVELGRTSRPTPTDVRSP